MDIVKGKFDTFSDLLQKSTDTLSGNLVEII
jgi:hypothetical protein